MNTKANYELLGNYGVSTEVYHCNEVHSCQDGVNGGCKDMGAKGKRKSQCLLFKLVGNPKAV